MILPHGRVPENKTHTPFPSGLRLHCYGRVFTRGVFQTGNPAGRAGLRPVSRQHRTLAEAGE